MSDVKWTDIGSLIVGITIPIVLHIAASNLEQSQMADAKSLRESQEKLEIDSRTLSRLRELDKVVGKALSEKSKLDIKSNEVVPSNYEYAYINGNVEVLPHVLTVLNEYEELCTGANLGLYSREVIYSLRSDALSATFSDYHEFISQWRQTPSAKKAWNGCKKFLANDKSA